ncbi:MAG TPA: choice-of-anchor D domain-containing protein [Thermoanaerobaculia bacterium]|nr:choice-of-anchor D domain-containing protein [Thermoanaerobaculia bacterium]
MRQIPAFSNSSAAGRHGPRTAAYLALALLVFALCSAVARAAVVDINPNGTPPEPRFGGRSLGLTIHPFNTQIVYVATEQGGFFTSADGGNHWRHVDAIPIPLARDVLFDPQDPSILIASGRYDGRVANQGGIWVSNNGGATWLKPATSNPGCSSEASTWGIAIPNDPAAHGNVYVATDCGIAISANSGATWTHVDPCMAANAPFCGARATYFDVEARVVGGQVQLDVCGDEGYFRSSDGGATWSAPDPASPARAAGGAFNPCNVATAPGDPNTVYLTNYSGVTADGFCISRLMENAAGGASGMWTDMMVSANNCRDPWVVAHPDLAGDPNRFQVYYGDTQQMRVQRCNLSSTPRCATGAASWPTADAGSHSDTSDIAFDPTLPNGCPRVLSSDGGIATSTDCGATWNDGNRGLHALDVVTFSGTQQAGGVDLYAGTQDNGIYATLNSGATWTQPVGADGYHVMADRTPPVRVFHRVCFGCSNHISNRGIVGIAGFNDPAGNVPTRSRVQFGPRSYVSLTSDNSTPAQWTAWVTTNEGGAWAQLGPSPLPGPPAEIKAAGPAVAPTFYLRLLTGGQWRIYRLSGPLNSTATLTLANAGLPAPTGAWDVDPNNPLRLYATDAARNGIMFSTNGGTSWNPDPEITGLVTRGGVFRFASSSYGPQVWGIAFDPNSAAILVGTFNAGIFVSLTDGQDWLRVTGSEGISQAEEFFFDSATQAMYAASHGRGVWRLTLPKPHIQVPGAVDWGQTCAGSASYRTLNVCNTGVDDLVVDPITSSSSRFRVAEPSAGYPVTISHDFCFPFQARFDPLVAGALSGVLTVRSNDPDHSESLVTVAGEGTVGDVRVTGSTDFGVTSAWSPAERTVTVCNSGPCALQIFSAAIDCTDFTLTGNPLPASLEAGSCLDLVVGFTPLLPGKKTCHLTVTSADPDTPLVSRTLTARTPPALSLHAGLANPHGALAGSAKQGSTFNLDFVYPVKPKLAWDVRLGLTRFDGRSGQPDTRLWSLGANAKYTLNPAAPVRVFLNGGPGLYHFDPGTFEGGLSLGLGINVPAGPRFAIEATYNYHWVLTASPPLKYDQVQAGFLVSF